MTKWTFHNISTCLFFMVLCYPLWFQRVSCTAECKPNQKSTMRKYKKKSHTPLNRTDAVTFRLTMIHNRYLTLMYSLIFHSHLQNTQNQRQHTSLFIYTSFFYNFFLVMVPQTVSILTNNQLQFLQHSTMTKVINSLLHLINGNAILLTKASRLRVVLESTHAVKSCVIIKPTLSILVDKASI